MKKNLFLLFALGLLAIAIFTVKTSDSSNTKENTSSESSDNSEKTQDTLVLSGAAQDDTITYGKAEDFTLIDLEGNEVSLSDFKGKKVFLNFWATWCPPCKAEMPEIEKIYQETKDSDLVILAIEIGEPIDTVQSFIDENKYNFRVLLDLDQSVATSYGISAIPTSFFIDEDGNIVSKRVGGMSYDDMKEYIATLDK